MRYKENPEEIKKIESQEPTDSQESSTQIKKPNKLVRFLIIITIIIVCILTYARYFSTSGLIVKEYKIASTKIPANFHGFKIVQFSDLHYGTTINEPELKKIVNKINQLKPDIVIFTGDLVDEDHHPTDEQLNTLKKYLSQINATLFKYAISGNHDYTMDDINLLYTDTGFQYLENQKQDIYFEGSTPITLYAFPSAISGEPDYTLIDNENTNYKIVILHEPDSVDDILNTSPDLILAGHSHGGQVRLPIIGALYTPIGSKKYYEEHYTVDNTELYISSGLGTSGLRLRYFNKPSINLYRLESIPS